ncbi:hypothetical protein HC031_28095 [Planosporangium thailandense]|uniref:Uncharacterized protein n=1 Tax=Planosporangium thailandense TaxID=765197 RepID=A0ABX0Y5E5_9ACTN|nr:hypothetical protein [Planosporangium thailandense]NJC73558.1 hypothetical protein [Planosporangium thailandense]
MSTATDHDAIFVGGPRDGELFDSNDTGLIQLEIGGLVHRYIRTTAHRDRDGRSYLVYNYDGEVDPRGAQSGAETR